MKTIKKIFTEKGYKSSVLSDSIENQQALEDVIEERQQEKENKSLLGKVFSTAYSMSIMPALGAAIGAGLGYLANGQQGAMEYAAQTAIVATTLESYGHIVKPLILSRETKINQARDELDMYLLGEERPILASAMAAPGLALAYWATSLVFDIQPAYDFNQGLAAAVGLISGTATTPWVMATGKRYRKKIEAKAEERRNAQIEESANVHEFKAQADIYSD